MKIIELRAEGDADEGAVIIEGRAGAVNLADLRATVSRLRDEAASQGSADDYRRGVYHGTEDAYAHVLDLIDREPQTLAEHTAAAIERVTR